MTSPGADEQPLLRIDAVTKRFGGFVALDNVSVDIRSKGAWVSGGIILRPRCDCGEPFGSGQ